MPMEKIKQQVSDLAHNMVTIVMITLFMFPVQPVNALEVKPLVKTEAQLKQEVLDKFSKEIYKPSEMLTDEELVLLLKRESNGRPLAYNGDRNTGDHSYGMFQINMIGNLGPERLEKFNLKSNKELFDPVTNAEITYHMTNGGQDWSSWKGMTPKAQEWLLRFPTTEKK